MPLDPGLVLSGVSMKYGRTVVLHPVHLTVKAGEFLTVLGPSGSGKTTLLRIVGGFTKPTGGAILLGGQDITHLATHRRPFNTVFQDYALFPHLTVARNIGYGLMLRKTPRSEITRIVDAHLDLVGLAGMGGRYPSELSGGQRQRVALARAIVCEPKVILLDEPLAALDAALRRQMQLFLKTLQRQLKTTFLFVTHDQEEAITMSDRIVVMNAGQIEQVGSPGEIYSRPLTHFVASFIGENNVIAGQVENGTLSTTLGVFSLPGHDDGSIDIAIRPEHLRLSDVEGVSAVVEAAVYRGSSVMVHATVRAPPTTNLLLALSPGETVPAAGDCVRIRADARHISVIGPRSMP